MDPFDLDGMAAALVQVGGVVAVSLGGSRARGEHRPDSDWDIGIYYREPLDVPALEELAAGLTGGPAPVAAPGGWGPWVNGGAWLLVGDDHVDWILRDFDRVRRVWADCQAGRYEVGYQNGHPLGFWSPSYAGEVALGRVLADPGGELTALRSQAATYPESLHAALMRVTSQAEFTVQHAFKPAARGDVLYVSLCLSRAVGLLVQALFAANRRWCLNEKGALDVAAHLPFAPPAFADRARALLGSPGTTPATLTTAVTAAAALTTETRTTLRT